MKRKNITAALVIALGMTAGTAAYAGDPATNKEAAEKPADNTQRNMRDRDGSTLTTGDQSGNESDIKLTQQIRKEVVANDSLSMLGHNVKIISNNGVVTLRGPVKSEVEKQQIATTAERIAGAGRVQNHLEIAQ